MYALPCFQICPPFCWYERKFRAAGTIKGEIRTNGQNEQPCT